MWFLFDEKVETAISNIRRVLSEDGNIAFFNYKDWFVVRVGDNTNFEATYSFCTKRELGEFIAELTKFQEVLPETEVAPTKEEIENVES